MGYYYYQNQKQSYISLEQQHAQELEERMKIFSSGDGYVEEEDTVYEIDLECIKKQKMNNN